MGTTTLIRPPSVVGRFALTLNATPPLSLATLAGSLSSAGHDPVVIDAVGEALGTLRPSYREGVFENGLSVEQIVARVPAHTTLLGVSCLFSSEWPVVRRLIAALRAAFPSVPIVLGGEHATALPEHALQDAPGLDACALGEGEGTVVALADAVAAGRPLTEVEGLVVRGVLGPVRTGRRARLRELDAIPLPRWDLTPLENYLAAGLSFGVDRGRTLPLLASRGCPYTCTFCSSPSMWTTKWLARTPAHVVDEMEEAGRRWKVDNFDFYDLTAIVRRDWLVDFCNELLRRGLCVSWQLPSGTRSEALDADVLRLMAAAGCRNLTYAPESGSPLTLERIRKRVSLDRMLESMTQAVAAGLNVKANLIVGFPGETVAEMRRTIGFAMRMARAGVHDVSVWTYSPYPGTALFDGLVASGRIGRLDDDYFASLLAYSDPTARASWNELVDPVTLERHRVAGMGLFYATSWARRPTRPLRSALNLARGRYESRLEMSFGNLLRRLVAAPSAVAPARE